MTGFEPQITGIRSDRSINWATTTAPVPVVMVEVVVIVIGILAGFVVMLKLVVIAVVAGLWK